MMNWKIGSDPELFLKNKSDGSFYSAYNGFGTALKGTKADPEATSYGACQVDGMAVEINTVPTEEPEEFSSLIAEALDDIRKRFPEQDIDTKSIVNLDP
jgi:hypothetical protein